MKLRKFVSVGPKFRPDAKVHRGAARGPACHAPRATPRVPRQSGADREPSEQKLTGDPLDGIHTGSLTYGNSMNITILIGKSSTNGHFP